MTIFWRLQAIIFCSRQIIERGHVTCRILPFNSIFWCLGFPKGDIQNTTVLGTGIPKTRGYPKHCNRASEGKLEREGDFMSHRKCDFTQKDHSFFPLMLQSHSQPTILQHKKDSTKAVADSKECLNNLVCIICYIWLHSWAYQVRSLQIMSLVWLWQYHLQAVQ